MYIDQKSFRYLLCKRAVESSVDFVEREMPRALALESKEGLHSYGLQRAPKRGLVLEFGVRNGTSINLIARLTERTVHGFDSFEGLPDDGIIPRSNAGNAKWYAGKMHMKGAIPTVPQNVKLYKGWFHQTLPKFFEDKREPISYMHVDCDIYSSAKTVLECAAGALQSGSVIVFDDYLNYVGWQNNEHRALVEAAEDAGFTFSYIAFNYAGGVAIQIADPGSSVSKAVDTATGIARSET